jgi:antitoxin component YwqK of YwqJK toxin-antitoxin module
MSGQKWIEGSHKNNKRNGEWTFYNEDGTVYEIKEY